MPVSPELIRDRRSGLFTHFETPESPRKASGRLAKPHASLNCPLPPPLLPDTELGFTGRRRGESPLARSRKLLLVPAFRDASASAYYGSDESPAKPEPTVEECLRGGEVRQQAPRKMPPCRKEIFKPIRPSATSVPAANDSCAPRCAWVSSSSAAQLDPQPKTEPHSKGEGPTSVTPTSVLDQVATPGASSSGIDRGPSDGAGDTALACCHVCGQAMGDEAALRACKTLFPHLWPSAKADPRLRGERSHGRSGVFAGRWEAQTLTDRAQRLASPASFDVRRREGGARPWQHASGPASRTQTPVRRDANFPIKDLIRSFDDADSAYAFASQLKRTLTIHQ